MSLFLNLPNLLSDLRYYIKPNHTPKKAMKEKDDNSIKDAHKEKKDNKEKMSKKEGSSMDKKLVKQLTKRISKALDKKMEEVLKQVRIETRKALREVLEEFKGETKTDTVPMVRESLLENQREIRTTGQDFGAEEISVQIEPDELHMGSDLEVVEVGEDNKGAPASPSQKGKDKSAAAEGPKPAKSPDKKINKSRENPENQTDSPTGTKRRTAKPPKKDTAEQEIGTETGTGSGISPKA